MELLIRKSEKRIPTQTASAICSNERRNGGKIYIKAPVLIINGGKTIFCAVTGFLAVLMRMINIKIVMSTAKIEVAMSINISSSFVNCRNFTWPESALSAVRKLSNH